MKINIILSYKLKKYQNIYKNQKLFFKSKKTFLISYRINSLKKLKRNIIKYEDKIFKGYSADTYWNGWAEPHFDLKTIQEIIDYYFNHKCKEKAEHWKDVFDHMEILDLNNKIIPSKMTPCFLNDYDTVYECGWGFCWEEE